MIELAEICERLNRLAPSLAPRLLPNGRRSGNYWMASGIDDTGQSASLAVALAGARVGHWVDHGNARAGEERGDMLDLVELKECGGDKRRAVEWAKAELGIVDDFKPGKRPEMSPEERGRRADEARRRAEARERELEAERARKARRAKALFLGAEPLAGSPAEQYLLGRGVPVPPDGAAWPGSIRFHGQVWCGPLGEKRPAMVAGIFNAAGEQIGVHRTFLSPTASLLEAKRSLSPTASLLEAKWTKLDHPDLPDAKMVLGNQWGGFVPIAQGASGKSMRDMAEGEPVYVTEGIEDGLCLRAIKPDARIVCALNLGNIGAIVLPAAARRLVIVADRDDNPKAVDALERAIARQQARGLTVQLVMPPLGVKDLNDWVVASSATLARKRGVA